MRDRAFAKGLCRTCCVRERKPETGYCIECLSKASERYEAFRAKRKLITQGTCVRCDENPVVRRGLCRACIDADNKLAYKRAAALKELRR